MKVVRLPKAGLSKELLDESDARAHGSKQTSFEKKFRRWSEQYKTDMLDTDFAGQYELMVCAKELQLQLAVYKLGPPGADGGVRTADLLNTYPLEGASMNAPWVHLLYEDFGSCCGHFETTDVPTDFQPQPRTLNGEHLIASHICTIYLNHCATPF